MIVEVKVNPGSKKAPLVQAKEDGSLLIYVRQRALENRANQAAIELLAEYYKVSKRDVVLIAGQKSHFKRFKIPDQRKI